MTLAITPHHHNMSAPMKSKPTLAENDSAPIEFSLITSTSALRAVLSANIQADVTRNDKAPPAPFEDMTIFHALEPPSISVSDYVARVSKYAFSSNACLVAAYHYMTRAVEKEPKLALTSLSFHRLFITAVVLACKYFDDVSYNLLYYSKVGGLPYKELANLEISLLQILDFSLGISDDEFMEIENTMMDRICLIQRASNDNVVSDLCAKAALEMASIYPIELERPSDDVDFESIVKETRLRRKVSRRPRSISSAGSSASFEGSQMSRNSSMASVSHVDMVHSAETTPVKVEAKRFSNGGKLISDSPTTPASPARKTRIDSAVAW